MFAGGEEPMRQAPGGRMAAHSLWRGVTAAPARSAWSTEPCGRAVVLCPFDPLSTVRIEGYQNAQ